MSVRAAQGQLVCSMAQSEETLSTKGLIINKGICLLEHSTFVYELLSISITLYYLCCCMVRRFICW